MDFRGLLQLLSLHLFYGTYLLLPSLLCILLISPGCMYLLLHEILIFIPRPKYSRTCFMVPLFSIYNTHETFLCPSWNAFLMLGGTTLW